MKNVAKLCVYLSKCKNGLMRRIIRKFLAKKYHIAITGRSSIGGGLHLPHPQNIIIGGNSVVGNNCTIYQNVTIGQNHDFYPVINDNVTIYSGAVVVGKITIGKNAIIAANAVVIRDVLENEIVGGVPAHKIGMR